MTSSSLRHAHSPVLPQAPNRLRRAERTAQTTDRWVELLAQREGVGRLEILRLSRALLARAIAETIVAGAQADADAYFEEGQPEPPEGDGLHGEIMLAHWRRREAQRAAEWEEALRGLVRRDFNHPSIFSWVLFNEQWGLLTPPRGDKKAFLPETQSWVETAYDLAKSLDPTRLVEDNSPCCETGGHVKTDLNTWHMYLPGWKWKETLETDMDV